MNNTSIEATKALKELVDYSVITFSSMTIKEQENIRDEVSFAEFVSDSIEHCNSSEDYSMYKIIYSGSNESNECTENRVDRTIDLSCKYIDKLTTLLYSIYRLSIND